MVKTEKKVLEVMKRSTIWYELYPRTKSNELDKKHDESVIFSSLENTSNLVRNPHPYYKGWEMTKKDNKLVRV